VRQLHAQNRAAESAEAGERCALNLAGTFADGHEPGRGDWITAPSLTTPAQRLDLEFQVSRFTETPLRHGLPVHLHLGTADVVSRLVLFDKHEPAAGEHCYVRVELGRPIGALCGDRAILRDHGARRTLGGGRVVDPFPRQRRGGGAGRLAALDARSERAPDRALARLLDSDGVVDLAQFALTRNLTDDELEAAVAQVPLLRLGTTREPIAMTAARLAQTCEALTAELAACHAAEPDSLGPTRASLFARVRDDAPPSALAAALATLIGEKKVMREGAALRLAEHSPRLKPEDEKLWQRVHPLLKKGGLRPPRVRELAAALSLEPAALDRFLARAERFGRVAQIAENRYFLPETVRALAEIAAELAAETPEGRFGASQYKDRSGVGRNLTIRILEYLDRIGATRRIGDLRIVLRTGDEVFL
jgi:selenocysteine-specific elongation factor